MNNLLPGVQICSDLSTITNKVHINTGVVKHSFDIVAIDGSKSRYNGYAPLTSWRGCSSSEMQNLFYTDASQYYVVRLSKLPQHITQEYFVNAKRFINYDVGIKKILLTKYIKKIEEYLYANYLSHGVPQLLGLRILKKLDIPTITYDEKINSYIGLHIDCWEGINIDEEKYPNRICVNLGNGPRFFYFVNLRMSQIKNLFKNYISVPDTKNELCLYFLQNQSSYPVIRLMLMPGEYYVAPTESIIHDAYFAGSEDITITLFGHFI